MSKRSSDSERSRRCETERAKKARLRSNESLQKTLQRLEEQRLRQTMSKLIK